MMSQRHILRNHIRNLADLYKALNAELEMVNYQLEYCHKVGKVEPLKRLESKSKRIKKELVKVSLKLNDAKWEWVALNKAS